MKPEFAVVGCGRVGMALARHLAMKGYRPVGFASRSLESARKAAEAAGFGGAISSDPLEVIVNADIIMITTPDHAIRGVAERIAARVVLKSGTVVLHCSGALSSAELASLKSTGAVIGSMHPLQSFAAEQMNVNPFAGIMMGIEGEPAAVECARRMAQDLGAIPFGIDTEGKVLYHASAVVASNYLVTLMNMAIQLLLASGVRSANMFGILKPLIEGTLVNIENAGIPLALTGPIARGDVAVVRSHVSELVDKAPPLLPLYTMLGIETIAVARAKGTLSKEAAEELREILS